MGKMWVSAPLTVFSNEEEFLFYWCLFPRDLTVFGILFRVCSLCAVDVTVLLSDYQTCYIKTVYGLILSNKTIKYLPKN